MCVRIQADNGVQRRVAPLEYRARQPGAQFICFTRSKVRILTPEEVLLLETVLFGDSINYNIAYADVC